MKYIEATNVFFQGDLGFIKIPNNLKIPEGFEELKPEPRGLILAYGEASGHAHVIQDTKAATVFFNPKSARDNRSWDEMYIEVRKPTLLAHDEHTPVMLQVGTYKKWLQKEYNFENEYKTVVD